MTKDMKSCQELSFRIADTIQVYEPDEDAMVYEVLIGFKFLIYQSGDGWYYRLLPVDCEDPVSDMTYSAVGPYENREAAMQAGGERYEIVSGAFVPHC